ncbi:MAG: hypothetical protein GX288_07420 [Clostridiales bacterium]|nr:hypothetical protein [Clostridiales bacterium]
MKCKKVLLILSFLLAITFTGCDGKDYAKNVSNQNGEDNKHTVTDQKEQNNAQTADEQNKLDKEQKAEEKDKEQKSNEHNKQDNEQKAEEEHTKQEREIELLQSLLENPGFEREDQLNWTGRGGENVALSGDEAYSGTYSLKTTGRTKTWEGPAIDLTNVLEKGKRYYFSLQLNYTDGPASKQFNLQFENHIGGEVTYPNLAQATIYKGQWGVLEGEYEIPDNEELTQYRLYIEVPWKPDDDVTDEDIIDFYIDHIIVTEVTPITYQKDITPLKDAFAEYFPIGAATSTHFLDEKEIYSEFIGYHYGVLVAGNAMKPDALQPTEGKFNWQETDKFVQFAEKNNMLLRGHTLLWHNQIPDWFFTDPDNPSKPASSEKLLERMETHIKAVLGKYKGKFYSWDVVNEVISDSNGLRGENENSKWKSIIGDVDGDGYDSDYIELAFKYAREADPNTKLIINDYGLEARGRKRTDMYELIKRMLEKGVPVDGVGLQMHISIYGPSPQEIEECIELFASLKEYNPDFTVEVTEMDMSVYNWMEKKKDITDELLQIQADKYKEIFNIFRKQAEKGNLSMVILWGIGDNDSWLENFPIVGRGDAGLLFDKRLQAKPAYWAIINNE